MLIGLLLVLAAIVVVRLLFTRGFWLLLGFGALITFAATHGWFAVGANVLRIALVVAFWALIVSLIAWAVWAVSQHIESGRQRHPQPHQQYPPPYYDYPPQPPFGREPRA